MKKILCLICITMLCSSNMAFANFANMTGGLNPGAINSMETRNLRIHEYQTRNKHQSAIVKPKTENQTKQPNLQNAVGTIKSIIFVDNYSIPTSELNVIVKNRIDTPMNGRNVADIRRDIMKYYQANGYYSAVPSVVSFDNAKGELVIQVKEGSKNSIIIE